MQENHARLGELMLLIKAAYYVIRINEINRYLEWKMLSSACSHIHQGEVIFR